MRKMVVCFHYRLSTPIETDTFRVYCLVMIWHFTMSVDAVSIIVYQDIARYDTRKVAYVPITYTCWNGPC